MSVEYLFINNQTPTGAKNGTNKVFVMTQGPNPLASLKVKLNGVLQSVTTDYTLSYKTITFINAPLTGDVLKVSFRYVDIGELYLEMARIVDAGLLAVKDTADFNADVTGTEKPADNATKNEGALADLNTVAAAQIDDAAVIVSKLDFDKFYVHIQFESVDGWDKSGLGTATPHPGGLQLLVSDTLNEVVSMYAQPMGGVEWAKNPIIQYVLKIWQITDQIIYFGSGGIDASLGCFWGFKVVDGTLYATHQKNATEYTTEITGITLTNRHIYRAIYTSTTSIKFYIDGVLKATHTTNLPEGADQTKANRGMFLQLKNTAALAEKEVIISDCNFIKDL